MADQFELLEKLGSGGMGVVYRARDTRLGRIVAVKVLSADNSADHTRRERFFHEAQAASALNHPNIVTIHSIVSERGDDLIVMECVNGKTLGDLIPKGGLRVPQIINYGLQMTDALMMAHNAGIVHRDLKPGNIMVTDRGLIKVLDFGLAKMMEPVANPEDPDATWGMNPITVEGSIIGTMAYMSPEQAEGKKIDSRSDIFSLGAVLYEMATGHRAFEGSNAITTLTAVMRDETRPIFEIAPDVPPELDGLIQRCLRKNPDERWQTMEEINRALQALKSVSDSGSLYRSAIVPPAPLPPRSPAPPPPISQTSFALPVPPPPPPISQTSVALPVPPRPAVIPPPSSPGMPARPPASSTQGPKKQPAVPAKLAGALALVVVLAGAGGTAWWLMRPKPAPVPAPTPAVLQTPVPAPPPASEPQVVHTPPSDGVLRNENILEMIKAKVPQSVIVSQIQSNKTDFNLSSPEVIKLVQAGVPPAVIEVMRNPTARPAQQTASTSTPAKQSQPANVPAATGTPPIPAAPPAVASTSLTIRDGTPIMLILAEDVPKDVGENAPLRFIVANDLKVNGIIVVAKGASANGVVDEAKKRKNFGGGKTTYRLETVESVDGKRLRLRTTPAVASGDDAKRPLEPKKSKPANLTASKGTEYPAYLDGDAVVIVGH